MKKSILLFISLFLMQFVFAQYTFSPSKLLVKNQEFDQLSYDSIHIANHSSTDTLKLKWELLQYDTIDETYIEFCASGNCYLGIPQSGSFPAILPGGFGWAGVHFWTGKTQATATAKLLIYKEGFIANGDTLTYILHAVNNVGIENRNNQNIQFSIYPNPAHDYLDILLNDEVIGCDLSIFSLLGEKVLTAKLIELHNNISLLYIQSGYYIVEIKNGKLRKNIMLTIVK